jgi:hypothetical protein
MQGLIRALIRSMRSRRSSADERFLAIVIFVVLGAAVLGLAAMGLLPGGLRMGRGFLPGF